MAAAVLVVDDHIGMTQAVSAMARMTGCDVAVAHSGEKALDHIAAHPVDLVVLDVSMTGISGLDVLRELGSEGRLPALPVVMFSSNETYRDEALRLGAARFVRKDEADELAALIEHFTSHVSRSTSG